MNNQEDGLIFDELLKDLEAPEATKELEFQKLIIKK